MRTALAFLCGFLLGLMLRRTERPSSLRGQMWREDDDGIAPADPRTESLVEAQEAYNRWLGAVMFDGPTRR